MGKEAFKALPHEIFGGSELLISLGGEGDPIEHATVPNTRGTAMSTCKMLISIPGRRGQYARLLASVIIDTNAAMLKFRLVTMIRDAVECGKISFVEVHEPRVIPDLDADDADGGEDLSKLSVADLKERLKAKGLPVGGKKAELIARLEDGEEE